MPNLYIIFLWEIPLLLGFSCGQAWHHPRAGAPIPARTPYPPAPPFGAFRSTLSPSLRRESFTSSTSITSCALLYPSLARSTCAKRASAATRIAARSGAAVCFTLSLSPKRSGFSLPAMRRRASIAVRTICGSRYAGRQGPCAELVEATPPSIGGSSFGGSSTVMARSCALSTNASHPSWRARSSIPPNSEFSRRHNQITAPGRPISRAALATLLPAPTWAQTCSICSRVIITTL